MSETLATIKGLVVSQFTGPVTNEPVREMIQLTIRDPVDYVLLDRFDVLELVSALNSYLRETESA